MQKVRDFLRRLFPPELEAWIPGPKLIAGVILYVAATVFNVGGEQVVHLPAIGDVTVSEIAIGVGVYLFPQR